MSFRLIIKNSGLRRTLLLNSAFYRDYVSTCAIVTPIIKFISFFFTFNEKISKEIAITNLIALLNILNQNRHRPIPFYIMPISVMEQLI